MVKEIRIMENNKKKVRVEDFEARFKQSYSGDGEKVFLTIKYNDKFLDVVKYACITGTTGMSIFGMSRPRYRVKRVFFRELINDMPELIFDKELIDNGTATFEFRNVREIDKAKRGMRDNIRVLLRNYLSNDVEQVIRYRVTHSE